MRNTVLHGLCMLSLAACSVPTLAQSTVVPACVGKQWKIVKDYFGDSANQAKLTPAIHLLQDKYSANGNSNLTVIEGVVADDYWVIAQWPEKGSDNHRVNEAVDLIVIDGSLSSVQFCIGWWGLLSVGLGALILGFIGGRFIRKR